MPKLPRQHSTVSRTPSGPRAKSNRLSLFLAGGTFFACVAWALASRYVAPNLLRSAYHGNSWPVLNRMIVNQASYPLSHYLTIWNAFAWHVQLALMLSGLLILLVARPEFQNAFWGPEPAIPTPGPEAKATVRGATVDAVKLSWREKLAGFAHSREMTLLLGAILLLALLLRLLYLGAKSLDEDEIFSADLARMRLSDFWWGVTHLENNSVLYFGILRFWIHLGQREFAIRGLSVILALVTVPAMYSIGTCAFGRHVGILGALLLAINGFHIQYSQHARTYTLLLLLVTLSSLFFLQSVRQGSRRNWIRYIVTSTLAIYAHLFAVLVLVAHWVFLLLLPRRLAPWRRLVPSTAAIAFLALPIEFLALFRGGGQLSWIPGTTVRRVYNFFASLAGKPDNILLPGYGTAALLFVYSIPVVASILALAASRPWSTDHAETRHLAFFLTWLSVPILLALVISTVKPVFLDRYLFICLPPFILLASYGLSRLRKTWLVVALLCVMAGLTAPGLLAHYKLPDQEWRELAQYVLSKQKPGDAAVFFPAYIQSRVEYYLQKEPAKPAGRLGPNLTLLVPAADSSFGPLLRSLPSQYDRVWFIGKDYSTKALDLRRPALPKGGADAAQERSIEVSLATEFPGMQEEKRFPGELVVVLYRK